MPASMQAAALAVPKYGQHSIVILANWASPVIAVGQKHAMSRAVRAKMRMAAIVKTS